MRTTLATTLLVIASFAAPAVAAPPEAGPEAGGAKVTRLPDNPILRPDMVPKDDGAWSGNLNFPSLVRVPDWVEHPLGRYYLYFSAHHGSYIRLAYADRVEGPWTVYEPGTLRLGQVEAANGTGKAPPDRAEPQQRHVASPDVHVDPDRKQIRMYFHYWLPKLGHKASVAVSADGLKFEPRPGAIAGPYLRVFRRAGAYFGLDDRGVLVRSPDGLAPFEPASEAVRLAAAAAPPTAAGGARTSFRHGGVDLDGDTLSVYFTRVGDAPERVLLTRLRLTDDPSEWRATPPAVVLEPEREYEGVRAELVPSTVTGQTQVRQLRDPFVFREGGRAYLLYTVAGETGIALAEIGPG